MAKVFKDAKQMGQLLRKRRRDLGWSQAVVGDMIGVSYQQVQKYEKGTNTPTLHRIGAVMGALNLNLSDFLVNPKKHLK